MAGERANLRDLIESRAAAHGIAPRTLWKWVLDAIDRDMITPVFPEGVSLDTEFDHGGQRLTWRRVIKRVLPTIDRYGPPGNGWTGTLKSDVAGFDRCLKNALEDQQILVSPKRRAGAKVTLREEVASFIVEKYPSGIPAAVTYKQIIKNFCAERGKPTSERTVRRALGRK